MATSSQRPLELILARNLLSSLSTPAFLVSLPGDLIFYNESAGTLLGRPFEARGPLPAQEWIATFGPFSENGEPLPIEEQPLTAMLRGNRAAHARHLIRALDGTEHTIEVTGLPIIGAEGFHGAMVFFWPVDEAAG